MILTKDEISPKIESPQLWSLNFIYLFIFLTNLHFKDGTFLCKSYQNNDGHR